jgi:hypothetical protein
MKRINILHQYNIYRILKDRIGGIKCCIIRSQVVYTFGCLFTSNSAFFLFSTIAKMTFRWPCSVLYLPLKFRQFDLWYVCQNRDLQF